MRLLPFLPLSLSLSLALGARPALPRYAIRSFCSALGARQREGAVSSWLGELPEQSSESTLEHRPAIEREPDARTRVEAIPAIARRVRERRHLPPLQFHVGGHIEGAGDRRPAPVVAVRRIVRALEDRALHRVGMELDAQARDRARAAEVDGDERGIDRARAVAVVIAEIGAVGVRGRYLRREPALVAGVG